MAIPCPTCIPLDCDLTEDTDLYTLEGSLYPFVLNCPPGFDCGGAEQFSIVCCGQLLSRTIPPTATADDRTTIIQEVLNECAVRQLYCGDLPTIPTTPGTPVQLYYNVTKVCSVTCPDGNAFVFTVPAGTFINQTQALADAQAQEYACQQAALRKLCLGSLPKCTCLGTAYSATIPHSGGVPPLTWSVHDGALPTGMTLSATGVISGTPT